VVYFDLPHDVSVVAEVRQAAVTEEVKLLFFKKLLVNNDSDIFLIN